MPTSMLDQRDISYSDIIETGTIWALASTGIPSTTLTETLFDGSTSLISEDPVSTYTVDEPKFSTETQVVQVTSGGKLYPQTIPGTTETFLYVLSGKTETGVFTQTATTDEVELATTTETYTLETLVTQYYWTSTGTDTTKIESGKLTRTGYTDA
jgi:hypothetical protein